MGKIDESLSRVTMKVVIKKGRDAKLIELNRFTKQLR